MPKVSFLMASASRGSVFGVQTSTARKHHRSGHTEGGLTTTPSGCCGWQKRGKCRRLHLEQAGYQDDQWWQRLDGRCTGEFPVDRDQHGGGEGHAAAREEDEGTPDGR